MLFAVIGSPRILFSRPKVDSISLTWRSPGKGGRLALISNNYIVMWTNNNYSDIEEKIVNKTTTELTNLIHNTNYAIDVFATSNENKKSFSAHLRANTCKYIF